jgi:hypothetical protein
LSTDPVERLREDLAPGSATFGSRQPAGRAQALREYVAASGRQPVGSYDAIRQFLAEDWEMPVVEISGEVPETELVGGAGRDSGRCGVRLLDLLGTTSIYLVVCAGAGSTAATMRWSLLHELGHFASHFEMLESVSVLYQRLCLNPSLEDEIGGFARRSGHSLRGHLELEADLFALEWLLPRWREASEGTPPGLTRDGFRYLALRGALGGEAMPGCLDAAAAEGVNRAGAEQRVRSEGTLAAGATLWSRAAWLLWNRERFAYPLPPSEPMLEYREIVRGPSRFVPELANPVTGQQPLEDGAGWLRRLGPAQVAEAVDAPQWMPLLVPPPGPLHPEFNLPIRPLPTPGTRDSRLPWGHMFKSPLQRLHPLEYWIEKARASGAGLLLFPRNPAERVLDGEGRARP